MPAKPGPARLDGSTICLTLPQAAKVRDSLNALPLVRKEARSLRSAAANYRLAADTARAAYQREQRTTASVRLALGESKSETARQTTAAQQWKTKARHRGLLNWLGALAVLAFTAISVSR